MTHAIGVSLRRRSCVPCVSALLVCVAASAGKLVIAARIELFEPIAFPFRANNYSSLSILRAICFGVKCPVRPDSIRYYFAIARRSEESVPFLPQRSGFQDVVGVGQWSDLRAFD